MSDRLTQVYQGELKHIRSTVSLAVGREWKALGSWNEADVPRFVSRVSPLVSAGQSRAVSLTQAYVARKTNTPIVAVDFAALQSKLRNGVPPAVVYKRPFIRVWSKLKQSHDNYSDGDFNAAVQVGQDQAESNSDMDVALALVAAYVVLGSLSGDEESQGDIVAWRRVAEPACCEFCQMLDGVHTGPDQPQPLHNRCGCTAEPITRGSRITGDIASPGDSIEGVTIHEHGELGPVIGQKGDNFTTAADLNISLSVSGGRWSRAVGE